MPRIRKTLVRPRGLLLLLTLAVGFSVSPAFVAGEQAARPQVPATIAADPNPVPAGAQIGTTSIKWDTGDGSWGQVFLSAAGGPEQLFVEGPGGAKDAPWISGGSTYEFRLYAGRERKVMLATVTVTRRVEPPPAPAAVTPAAPRISASPNPVPAGGDLGRTAITWDTGDGRSGQVYLSVPKSGGEEVLVGAGPRGSIEAPWITAFGTYDFRLYAGQDRRERLAEVTVTRMPVTAARHAPLVSAPNPAPPGGLTLVAWDTADGSPGQVYLEVNGRPATLVGEGATGFRHVLLPADGSVCRLSLYEGPARNRLLASVPVITRAGRGFRGLDPAIVVLLLMSLLLLVATAAILVRSARTGRRHMDVVRQELPAVVLRAGPYVTLAIAVAYFVAAAARHVSLPGLNYDEVLFVNAALGGITDSFIYKRVLGVPFMLGNYLGALKAYLYFPVFRVLGVSPETVRLPIILVSAVLLCVSFAVARKLWGRWPAALAVVLMATDPAFVVHARLDWGPAMLTLFFKMTALYFLYELIRTRAITAWLGLSVSIVLGLYDKSIFIWFVLALAVMTVVCYRKTFSTFAGRNLRYLVAGLLGLGVVVTLLLRLVFQDLLDMHTVLLSASSLWRRTVLIWTVSRSTMNGSATYLEVTGSPLSQPSLVYPVVIACVVMLLAILAWRMVTDGQETLKRLRGGGARHGVFFLGLGVLVFVQMVVTPKASQPHHAMMLYPFHLFVGVSAAILSLDLATRWRRAAGVVLAVLFAALVISQHRAVSAQTRDLQDTSRFRLVWDPRIYTLSNYLEQVAPELDLVVIGDWAIYNQLFALSSPETRLKYNETWTFFQTWKTGDRDAVLWLNLYARKANVALVLHAETTQQIPEARKNLLAFAAQFLPPPVAVLTIPDSTGRPVFEVYVYKSRSLLASAK